MADTYGVRDKAKADELAEYLKALHPENRYEVQIHDHIAPNWLLRNLPPRESVTWGVVAYEPYCEQMPFRCTGFVWHDYTKPLPSLGLLSKDPK